jgi:hypothetical protein
MAYMYNLGCSLSVFSGPVTGHTIQGTRTEFVAIYKADVRKQTTMKMICKSIERIESEIPA